MTTYQVDYKARDQAQDDTSIRGVISALNIFGFASAGWWIATRAIGTGRTTALIAYTLAAAANAYAIWNNYKCQQAIDRIVTVKSITYRGDANYVVGVTHVL